MMRFASVNKNETTNLRYNKKTHNVIPPTITKPVAANTKISAKLISNFPLQTNPLGDVGSSRHELGDVHAVHEEFLWAQMMR